MVWALAWVLSDGDGGGGGGNRDGSLHSHPLR